jgi:hypothetical protein
MVDHENIAAFQSRNVDRNALLVRSFTSSVSILPAQWGMSLRATLSPYVAVIASGHILLSWQLLQIAKNIEKSI